MDVVILTNDNFFSFTVLKKFLKRRKNDVKLFVFSSSLIGKKGTLASIKWSFSNTGFPHTVFKLLVYGVFRAMKILCNMLPFIPNNYSSYLWVKRNNMNYICTSDINDKDVVQKIRSVNPDLVISVSMNQIVGKEILDLPPRGCINIHCAPLPRYGGMSPYIWALANNEAHSAATIHYMDEGLDTGNIIVQEKVNVVKSDSAFALFHRCCLKAGELLIKVIDEIESDRVTSYEQDLSQKTYFSWPTKQCVNNLRKNGYGLARITDFTRALLNQPPRND